MKQHAQQTILMEVQLEIVYLLVWCLKMLWKLQGLGIWLKVKLLY